MKIHGSRDDQMPLLLNGMPFNNMNNTGGGYNHTLAINTGTVEEMTVTTSGMTAETRTSGVVANSVAKEGSNRFAYYFYGDFTNGSLQSDNLSQDLISRGCRRSITSKRSREINPTMGGPIAEGSVLVLRGLPPSRRRRSTWPARSSTRIPFNPQYCATVTGALYQGVLVPDSRDLTRQAFSGDQFHRSYTMNLTTQVSPKNKVNLFYHLGQRHLDNDSSVTLSPEAASFLYVRARLSGAGLVDQPGDDAPAARRRRYVLQRNVGMAAAEIPGIINGYGPGVTGPKDGIVALDTAMGRTTATPAATPSTTSSTSGSPSTT